MILVNDNAARESRVGRREMFGSICVWWKVVEAEGLMILVNDNAARESRVGRREMFGSICVSPWKSTKGFFRRGGSFQFDQRARNGRVSFYRSGPIYGLM